jgi:hypothetical protein
MRIARQQDLRTAMTPGSAGDHASGRPAPEAVGHNLADLMNQVLHKINDAERRNGELLRDMQERLASLGHDARAVRPAVPAEYRPGFERIEDGMSLLAARIAETYFARATTSVPAHSFTSALNAHLSGDAASSVAAAAPAAVFPAVSLHLSDEPHAGSAASQAIGQPNPLRSSSPGQIRPRSGQYGADVDTFDVVESLPGNPAEPWSPDQAAALTQLYSSGDAQFGEPAPFGQHAAPAYVRLERGRARTPAQRYRRAHRDVARGAAACRPRSARPASRHVRAAPVGHAQGRRQQG